LQDPRQRRLFTQNDLRDFFTLKPDKGSSSNNLGDSTADFTRGVGAIPSDSALRSASDDHETLEAVFKCKGLAGVFDHDTVDSSSAMKKSLADIEMDEKAKKIAANAACAIASSTVVNSDNNFSPTWTGSKATEIKRFGSVKRESGCFENRSTTSDKSDGEISFGDCAGYSSQGTSIVNSSSLLENLRKRSESLNMKCPISMVSDMEQDLRQRIAKFIVSVRTGPSTDEIVSEFRREQSEDAKLFRNALQYVAKLNHGRWNLK